MRIVIDTNVFVSGVFFSGPPARILEAWKNRNIQLVLSPSIFEEYRRVCLALSQQYSKVELSSLLELVAINAEMVPDTTLPSPVCTDPDDDKFLACAHAANAMVICSGDKALLKTSGYLDIQVMTPAAFCRQYVRKDERPGTRRLPASGGMVARRRRVRLWRDG